MSDAANKAVFLSYASQDAEAARRICESLRSGGVEVWFDQSELIGGDAWDAKIRKQIADCALFLPVISAATNSRARVVLPHWRGPSSATTRLRRKAMRTSWRSLVRSIIRPIVLTMKFG